MKGRAIRYAADELDFIEETATAPRRMAHAAFCELFGRKDVSLVAYKALCKRKGWLTGRTGCFPKGHVPDNKGKRMPFNANSARTQFKKGSLPHNTKYAGHERVDKDGYIWISVNETNPYTGFERRYVLKHRWLWEKKNGPVPDGHALKSLDGDRTNTDPSNWRAIPHAMRPRLNGINGRDYDNAPAVLKPLIFKVTELEHAARERAREGEA